MSLANRFIINPLKTAVQKSFRCFGYELLKTGFNYDTTELNIISKVRPFTATSTERIVGVINSVKYFTRNGIEGDFVECGVWRGGSMMAAMLALLQQGDTSRNFYLYDTYEGMTPPSEKDVSFDGIRAVDALATSEKKEGPSVWCVASLEDVKNNVFSTGYPKDKIHFIKGRVEDTLPTQAPQKIALLRLDTDWYDSTRHELLHLYPLLSKNGVLILDDYGHWQGAKKAVDEYFARQPFAPLLTKLDYTGRLIVKPM
jgi:O-methyltransferase